MNVGEILREARKATEEAGLEGELQVVGFEKAVEMLAQVHVGSAEDDSILGAREQSEGRSVGGSSTPLGRIVAKLGVKGDTVDHVYNVADGELEVVVGHNKLGSKAATATKELALLVAAGRQAAGLEDWTSANEIRRWCEHFKRYDAGNFASTLKEMENLFTFRGTPRKREVRMTAPAWTEATALVRRLGGEA